MSGRLWKPPVTAEPVRMSDLGLEALISLASLIAAADDCNLAGVEHESIIVTRCLAAFLDYARGGFAPVTVGSPATNALAAGEAAHGYL